ncbi:MAG: hypothetical protein JWO62_2867 [Acidimicrobiaceae bacterium]|jgi:hypothetical protein|nr:hypothetical protein [Acidimicrobiaceae bacterium]
MQLAWLWIPIALVVTALIVGSLLLMSVIEHHWHQREQLELDAERSLPANRDRRAAA